MSSRLLLLRLLWLCPFFVGCSAHYVYETRDIRALADQHKEPEAIAALDAAESANHYDELLYQLDRGAWLHRSGAYAESTRMLNAAADLADRRETVSFSEELLGKAPWRMGTLERQALHVLNTINYLELNQPDDAVVEARLTDSLLIQGRLEEKFREQFERNISLAPFDEDIRDYLERLVIGRYLSGIAHELSGNQEDAFIDYYDAWKLSRSAPPGAPTHVEHLGPWLLRNAKLLGRKELPELERDVSATDVPSGGELIVIIEAGKVPERAIEGPEGQGHWTVKARSWSHHKAIVEVSNQRVEAQTVTSLENIQLRRGYLGAMSDTERNSSFAVNAVMLGLYIVAWPVMFPVVIRRAWEVNIRLAQAWLALPAEFQIARLSVPLGTQHVLVDGKPFDVTVSPKRPALLIVVQPE
ncbi:MAG: hypothetical protein ACJ790_14870 [Myxococcaceae bacterium]